MPNVRRAGIFGVLFCLYGKENEMPKTTGQLIFFTAVTAWLMVFVMTVYNTVLATGQFTNATFITAFKTMWIEYIIIFLLAFFVSGHIAKFFVFRVVQPGDRPIFIIFAIQTFTVVAQVFFASFLALFHSNGDNADFIPNYIMAYIRNFVMALPIQLFIAGPLARFIFRSIFCRKKE